MGIGGGGDMSEMRKGEWREREGERRVPYSSCHVTGDLCPPFKSFPSLED